MAQTDRDSRNLSGALVARGPRRRLPWPIAAPLSLLVAACLAAAASAQQYKTAPVNDRLRLDSGIAQRCAKDPAQYAANKDRFQAYFKEYFFPAMTRNSPDDLADLGDMRYDLFRRYLWPAASADLQEDLTKLAYEAMLPIVKDSGYHPAVRYNAILILGMLDDQYAIEVGGDRRPPKPMRKANQVLTYVVDIAAEGKAIPPPLVVGALVGLERHARFHDSLPADDVTKMTGALLKLLAWEKPSKDVDREVFAWMKLQAATALAAMGQPGQGNQIHQALMALLGNDKLSLDERCQVAGLLGDINYDGVSLADATTVVPLMALTVKVSENEAKRARDFEQLQLTSGGRASNYDDEYDQDQVGRSRLMARLVALRSGLKAVGPGVTKDSQSTIDAVVAAMNPVIDAASDKDVIDLDVVDAVKTMANQIQSVAQAGGSATTDETAEGSF